MKKTKHTILTLCLVLAMVLPAGTVHADSQGPKVGFDAQAHLQQFAIEQFNKGTCTLAELIHQLRLLYGGAGNQTPGNGAETDKPQNDASKPNQDAENNTENNAGNNTEQNGTTTPESGSAQQAAAARVLTLTNKERQAAGLSELTLSPELSRVAQAKAEDMARNGYFSHTSPTYGSPFDMMTSYGITYHASAENIAKGYKTPESVVAGWMNSSGHRANILNSTYTQLGVGYAVDQNGTVYWVQMFIKP